MMICAKTLITIVMIILVTSSFAAGAADRGAIKAARKDVHIKIDGLVLTDIAIFNEKPTPRIVEVDIADVKLPIMRVELYLNGQSLLQAIPHLSSGKSSTYKALCPLRRYGNELSVKLLFVDNAFAEQTVHPFLRPAATGPIGRQWNILVAGSGLFATASVKTFADLTQRSSGANVTNVAITSGTDTSVISGIYSTAARMATGDHLNFYYSGVVSSDGYVDECLFSTTKDISPETHRCLTFGGVLHQLSRLNVPSISVVLDLAPPPGMQDAGMTASGPVPGEVFSGRQVNNWTDIISDHSHLELLVVTSRGQRHDNAEDPAAHAFAASLREWWVQSKDGTKTLTDCRSLSDLNAFVNQGTAERNTTSNPDVVHAVYVTSAPSNDSFCLSPQALPRVALQLVEVHGSEAQVAIASSVFARARETIISVNGVAVRRLNQTLSQRPVSGPFRVLLNAGLNQITVVQKNAESTIGEGSLLAPGPKRRSEMFNIGSKDNLPRITISQPSSGVLATEQQMLSIVATIHDHARQRTVFEVTNNGVLVDGNIVDRSHLTDAVEETTPVLLQEGVNNITLREYSGKGGAERDITVIRHSPQVVAAVVIAPGEFAAPSPNSLRFTASDAQLMRDLLIRYSDALPKNVIVLNSESASSKTVSGVLAPPSKPVGDRSQPTLDIDDRSLATLIVYFSGFGSRKSTGVAQENDGQRTVPSKCVYLASDEGDLKEPQCLPISELLTWMRSSGWGKSILILDASFDGATGLSQGEDDDGQLRFISKTVTYQGPLVRGGEEQEDVGPTQMVIYAAQPQGVALESENLRHGIFTLGLSDALTQANKEAAREGMSFRVSDVIASTNEYMRRVALREQISSESGEAVVPNLLRSNNVSILRREWSSSFTKMARDLYSLKAMDRQTLTYAEANLRKAEAIEPSDLSVITGDAIALRYEGLDCTVSDECAQLKDASRLLADATKRSGSDADNETRYLIAAASSAVHRQQGLLDDAMEDQKRAAAIDSSSLMTTFTLAELDLAKGDWHSAESHLETILNFGSQHSSQAERVLPPADWGKAVVWRALLLRREGKATQAANLLYAYSRKSTFKYERIIRPFVTVSDRVLRVIGKRSSNKKREMQGASASDDPWMILVANFLLNHRDEKDVLTYFDKVTGADYLLSTCSASTYVGMRRLIHGNSNGAQEMFEKAVKTHQTTLAEYWVAQALLKSPQSVLRPN